MVGRLQRKGLMDSASQGCPHEFHSSPTWPYYTPFSLLPLLQKCRWCLTV
ncbi:hypothetical protein Hanom_Chr00s000004g01607061 [Helianthus anomalus]